MNNVERYCEKVIRSVVSDIYEDVQIEEINIQKDHLHIMLVVPPKYSISKVVGDIKRASSRIMRKRFDYLKKGRESLWSIGYFVSSVGLDEKHIRQYIKYQQEQDSGQLKAEWDKGATGKA